jgi:hypothetical protein
VPTGAPTASAISRYERLLISRSTKVSRNVSARACTSHLIVTASRSRSVCASDVCCSSRQSGCCSAASDVSSIGLFGEAARVRRGRRCAGSQTATASSQDHDSCRNLSAHADSIPAPRPPHRPDHAANSARACKTSSRWGRTASRKRLALSGSSLESLTGIAPFPPLRKMRVPGRLEPTGRAPL